MSLKKDRQRAQEERKTELDLCHKMATSLYKYTIAGDIGVEGTTELMGTYLSMIIMSCEYINKEFSVQQFVNWYLLEVEKAALSKLSNLKETTCH